MNNHIRVLSKFFFGLLICLFLFSSCFTKITNNRSLEIIKYGGQGYPEEYLLKGKNFWSQYGLTVEHLLFSSSSENNQALFTGAIDINITSSNKCVELFDEMGNEAVIIAASQRGDRFSTMIRADSDITSWYDMVGKPVGIRLGTGAEHVIRLYLDEINDLHWGDFEWVNLKVEDMGTALVDGSIVSFTAWEPIPAIAQVSSNAKVMMSYGDVAQMPVLIHTSVDFAKSHRKELVAFLRGHIDKTELINSDVDEAAHIAIEAALAEGVDLPPEVFNIIFERVDFSLEIDDSIISSLKKTAQLLKHLGIIEEIPNFTVDTSYLEQAIGN